MYNTKFNSKFKRIILSLILNLNVYKVWKRIQGLEDVDVSRHASVCSDAHIPLSCYFRFTRRALTVILEDYVSEFNA